MPAVPDSHHSSASHVPSHTSLHLGRQASPNRCSGVGSGGVQGGSPGIERYRESTYCSQRRADGNPPHWEYLRRGARHGCTYMYPYDGFGDDAEPSWLALDGCGASLPSSPSSLYAPADTRAATAPHRCCTSAGRSPPACRASSPHLCDDAWRGGNFGSRIRRQSSLSPHLPSGPASVPLLACDGATDCVSQYAARPRAPHTTSVDDTSRRVSSAVDAGSHRDTRMPPTHSPTGAGEPPSSKRPPLLPSVTSTASASSLVGLTSTAEPRAQASVAAEAALEHRRPGDSARQPQVSAGSLPSRSRDSLAHLVAKIRAEVSRDTASLASGLPTTNPLRNPADGKPRATAEGEKKRHRRPERLQEQGHPAGAASPAEQAPVSQDARLPHLSSFTASAEAEEAVMLHAPVAPRSTSAGGEGGSRAYRSSTAPPAAYRRACGARSPGRHDTSGKRCRSSRPRRSSSSLSACSTRSSSSVFLRSTVRRAEAALQRLQARSRGSICSRAQLRSPRKAKGLVGDSPADDTAAVAAAVTCDCEKSSAHAGGRGKDCIWPDRGRAGCGHSAPPLPSRRQATRVPSRQSLPSLSADALLEESPGAPQRAHASDRVAGGAAREVRLERSVASAVKQAVAEAEAESRRQQEIWHTTQEHRIERLREGLSALCAAVRKDLQKVREEVDRVRAEALSTAEDTRRRMREKLATALQPDAPAEYAGSAPMQTLNFCPNSVVAAVAQCAPADQRRLASLLLPHFRPVVAEMVQEEVQCQLRLYRREQQAAQHALEQRLRAYVEEARASHQCRARADEAVGGEGTATVPAWAGFSSADAFDAHLRATARAVLLEEDDRRYSLANENERRHERRVEQLQQAWKEMLSSAQAKWKAEWKAILERESDAWTHRARAPLQQHTDILQDIVKALTRDVTHLQEQQGALFDRLSTNLRQEREMRVQEQTQLSQRVEQRVRQLLPREVEAACARLHACRDQRLAAAASQSTAAEVGSPGTSRQSAPTTASAAAAASAASSAEELRLSVVQPAMEHMRRLLVLHQEVIDSAVKDRCRRAEHTVEGHRRVWSQNVAELRAKLSTLRTDVRGALAELCENLNVASPAL
ncbi:hypothetical protein LSCM1_05536 [Leishmania martiniquensis]|uniref:Uncharacterized protein n=1 Tax=Leishmania martiniquensis TaxID=1580590 RepID=A0A836HHR5_9TRYP|nr:hypothetical protein LSCM1_05536 [Leishmania martiniquensis]